MPTTILFGSSYIERMRRYCDGDLNMSGHTTIFCVRGGLRTDRMDKPTLQKAMNAAADIAFINVGGNDIETESRPRDIFDRIVSLVDTLRCSGVKKFFIAEVMTRGKFKAPGLTKAVFDKKRKKLNKLLFKKYGEGFVEFRDIHYPGDYLSDLVHLETKETVTMNIGMKKYISRIRRCLASC